MDALPQDDSAAWRRRLERERQARQEAEALLESKALELFQANLTLQRLSGTLEARVSELEAERARALRLAGTDDLTGLSNRGAFYAALGERLERARSADGAVALFMVDLDRFKAVNDAMGHEGGDCLLRDAAERLTKLAGAEGFAGRLGGDEFAMVLAGPRGTLRAGAVARQICTSLRAPHEILGRHVDSSASVGFAMFPDDADNLGDLQRFADTALYRAKNLGRDRSAAFDGCMRSELRRRKLLEGELRRAVERCEIVPWFQPIFDAVTGRVAGLEVLARWEPPDGSVIGPRSFVPVAEDMGLIGRIDEQLFDAACRIVEPWVARGWIEYVAVNVSPRELMTPDFSAKLIGRLQGTVLPAGALVVEITEAFLVQDMTAARRHIERLAAVGVKVALDDFGTGCSNLRALLQLPIDNIKIDQSLIADLGRDPRVARLLQGMLQAARALGLNAVAEGVEQEDQAVFLRGAGCPWLQGYLFARPAPPREIEVLLASYADMDSAAGAEAHQPRRAG